jgi:hypothetical protein
MATTPVYLLKILGNPTIEISQDELRTLLGEIEAELHQSKAYRRAVAMLQNLLGSSSDQANVLFKSIGREAIGLAFRQFVQQYHKLMKISNTKTAQMKHHLLNKQIPLMIYHVVYHSA